MAKFGELLGNVGAAIFGGIPGWVSSAMGTMVGGVADRFNDRRARKNEWDFYRGQGATIPEIMGSGGVGTGSQTGSTVLGNQQAELNRIKMQQSYDREQRNLDRAVLMRGQDAGIQQAGISAGASRYGADVSERIAMAKLDLEKDRYASIELPRGLNEIVTTAPDWKRQELLAKMGVDNALATAIMGSKGIDIMDPNTLQDMSTQEFRQLIRDIYGYQSRVFGESAGAATIVGEGLDEAASAGGSLWNRIFGDDSGDPVLGH